MLSTITIVLGIMVIAMVAHIWQSNRSLRRLLTADLTKKLDDKFVLEHIVHTRTSLNVLYASITIITFVLTFLGVKAVKDITDRATQSATEAVVGDLQVMVEQWKKSIDVEQWKRNQEEAAGLLDDLRERYSATRHVIGTIDSFIDTVGTRFHKLYVISNIPISKNKQKYLFSELKTVDGLSVPTFKGAPSAKWFAHLPGGFTSEVSTGIKITSSSIEFFPAFAPASVELWLYGVRK